MYVEAGTLLGYQGNFSGDPNNPVGVHLHFSIVLDDGQGKFRNELEIAQHARPVAVLWHVFERRYKPGRGARLPRGGWKMSEFAGKTVLVTGAGRGIGRVIAEAFAAQGANVAANDVTPINLDVTVERITAAGGRCKGYVFDVAMKMPVQAMIEQVREDWGSLDILVNNAGVEPHASILEMDEWDWRRTIDVNLSGPFFTIQSAARVMQRAGRRRHRQHRLHRRAGARAARARRVCRQQDRLDRADARGRPRAGGLQHPRQRRLPGGDRDRDDRRPAPG